MVADLGLEPPVSMEMVASYRSIDDIRVEPLISSGSLTPEPAGFVMRLHNGDSRRRRRFTGFHEIAHTFLPGYADVVSLRCSPRGSSKGLEVLADAGAAAMLLPESHFASDLLGAPFGFEGVDALADLYDASQLATAFRFVRYWPEPAAVVQLDIRLKKSDRDDRDARPQLRVRNALPNGRWRVFLPRLKSAQSGSLLLEALALGAAEGPSTLKGELGLANDMPVQVSAYRRSYLSEPGEFENRVVALIRMPRKSLGRTK